MSKSLRALFCAAGLTGLLFTAGGFAPTVAQDKSGPKGSDKADPKKAVKTGTVEIYKDKSGDFRFRVKDTDGKVVAMPPKGYDTKEECQKVLDGVKLTLNTAKVTEVKDDKK